MDPVPWQRQSREVDQASVISGVDFLWLRRRVVGPEAVPRWRRLPSAGTELTAGHKRFLADTRRAQLNLIRLVRTGYGLPQASATCGSIRRPQQPEFGD